MKRRVSAQKYLQRPLKAEKEGYGCVETRLGAVYWIYVFIMIIQRSLSLSKYK